MTKKKCPSLNSINNQPCLTRATLPDEYNYGLCYYSFLVNFNRCNESSSTFDDCSGKICYK